MYSKFLCFEGNTLVKTIKGFQPIKDVKCSTVIYAFDEKNKTICSDIVTAIAKSLHSLCAIIRFEDGSSLKATIDHPLYVAGKGWCAVNTNKLEETYGVSVKQLEEGDFCLCMNNDKTELKKVIGITVECCSELFYCLSTEKFHSFTANSIIVHDVAINRFSQECLIEEGIVVDSI